MSNNTVFTTPILSHSAQDPTVPALKSEPEPSDRNVPVQTETVRPDDDADGDASQGSDDSDDWETDSLYRDLIREESNNAEHLNGKNHEMTPVFFH